MKAVSKEQSKILLNCGILEKWHTKTLDDFTNDKRALKIVRDYLDNYKEAVKDGVGFCLYGNNGVGKTLLLNASFKELFEKRNKVQILSVSSLITKFTDSWYDDESRKKFISLLQNATFLGIEEIGKQIKSERSNEMITHVLDTVIRYRVQRNKPIWITTNIPPKQLRELYSDDIASMLNEVCVPLQIRGEDIRESIREKNIKKYIKE